MLIGFPQQWNNIFMVIVKVIKPGPGIRAVTSGNAGKNFTNNINLTTEQSTYCKNNRKNS